MTKKILPNSQGFSLIELLIVAGLLGGLAFVFMHLNDRIIDTERKMMDMIEMNEIVGRVRYQLNDTVACNKTLSVEKEKNGYKLPSKLEVLVDRNGESILVVGKQNGKILVEKIQGVLDLQNSSIQDSVKMYNIIIQLKGPGRNARSIPFTLTVPILLGEFEDKSPRFIYCDSLSNGVANNLTNVLMEKMCESFQAPYDKMKGICDFGKSNGVFKPSAEAMEMMKKLFSEQVKNP